MSHELTPAEILALSPGIEGLRLLHAQARGLIGVVSADELERKRRERIAMETATPGVAWREEPDEPIKITGSEAPTYPASWFDDDIHMDETSRVLLAKARPARDGDWAREADLAAKLKPS